MDERSAHLRPLTGLRFVAAFLVLFSHSLLLLGTSPGVLRDAELTMAATGLCLFFCLSGFVLTWNYFDRFVSRPRREQIVSYGLARFARIYPLYALLLLIGIGFSRDTLDHLPSLVGHLFLVQAWAPHYADVERFLPVSWSLSVELFFYAAFPLALAALRRVDDVRTPLLVAAAVALVGVSFAEAFMATSLGAHDLAFADVHSASRWLRFFPPARLPDFLIGCVLARLLARGVRVPGALALAAAAVLPVLWLTPLLTGDYHSATGAGYSAFGWDAVWLGPLSVLLLWAAATPRAPVSRWLSTRTMVLLGGASYALYLTHQFVVLPVSFAIGAVDLPVIARRSPEFPLRIAGVWTLAIMASIGLFLAVEEPARRRLRARLHRADATMEASRAEIDTVNAARAAAYSEKV